MKTKSFKISEVNQKWLLIDAENKTLGRLSSRISSILMGKNKSQYTPNNDFGDFVVIINAEKIIVMHDGKLVGFDNHENLLKNNGIYQDLFSAWKLVN